MKKINVMKVGPSSNTIGRTSSGVMKAFISRHVVHRSTSVNGYAADVLFLGVFPEG